jgi:DnaJ-class molecular chaperone
MEHQNPYTVLGVTPTATQAEITRAYRAQLRALHPDTRITPPVSDKKLSDVLAAYRLLHYPDRRAGYHTAERTRPTAPTPTAADASAPAHIDTFSGPVQIPVTHMPNRTPADLQPPLWAGPAKASSAV